MNPHPTSRAAGATITFGVLLLGGLAAAHDLPLDAGAIEQRISYYKARLGGPATYPAYARLGWSLLDKAKLTGDWTFHEEAMRHLATSLAYQTNQEALLGLARGTADAHRFPEALRQAEAALSADSGSAPTLAALFDIRLALGQEAEAAAVLERLRQREPGFATSAREAALEESRGRWADAIGALRRATNVLAATPGRAVLQGWVFVRLGALHLAAGEAETARACYERALELSPADPLAREKIAEWHAARGDWAEARAGFGELVTLRPTAARRLGLAEAIRRMGSEEAAEWQERRALEELRQLARNGRVDQLRPLVLQLLEKDGPAERAEGLRWARRDAELRQDVPTLDALAWAHWRNHQTNEAVRLSGQIAAEGHASPLALLHHGSIDCLTGRRAAGVSRLRAALARTEAFGPHERRLEAMARALVAAEP